MTLNDIRRTLFAAGIEDAAWEARLLAAHFTGFSDARLFTMGNEELTAEGLEDAVRRRCSREPLQYILGSWDFMGLTFAVSPDCLIPRPDTETLVEAALHTLPPRARIADLCTGSGCIGIALAHYRPDITVTAVEIVPSTAAIARENAARLDVADRFTVLEADVTGDVFSTDTKFDCITANPPYIALDEMETLAPELSFEPRCALTDEGDGLSVIRGVIRCAERTLKPEGILLMEFGASQAEAVLAIAGEYGFCGTILRDAGGNDRVLQAKRAGVL